jgi:hypothetical protein
VGAARCGGVLAKREVYDPPNLVQQGDWKLGGAHRARVEGGEPAQRQRRRGPAAELGVVVAGRSMREIFGLLVPSVRRVEML